MNLTQWCEYTRGKKYKNKNRTTRRKAMRRSMTSRNTTSRSTTRRSTTRNLTRKGFSFNYFFLTTFWLRKCHQKFRSIRISNFISSIRDTFKKQNLLLIVYVRVYGLFDEKQGLLRFKNSSSSFLMLLCNKI